MTDSRRKGATGEREFAQAIYDRYEVKLHRRLEQVRSGGHDLFVDAESTGAVAHWLANHAIEVKRYRAVTPALIKQWWIQTTSQATNVDLKPLLAYRADRQPWLIVLSLDELVPDADTVFTISLDGVQALTNPAKAIEEQNHA